MQSDIRIVDVIFICLGLSFFVWIWLIFFPASHAEKVITEDVLYQTYVDRYMSEHKERPVIAPKVSLPQPIDVAKLQSVGFTEAELKTVERVSHRTYGVRSDKDFDEKGRLKPPSLSDIAHYYVDDDGDVVHMDDDEMVQANRLLLAKGILVE